MIGAPGIIQFHRTQVGQPGIVSFPTGSAGGGWSPSQLTGKFQRMTADPVYLTKSGGGVVGNGDVLTSAVDAFGVSPALTPVFPGSGGTHPRYRTDTNGYGYVDFGDTSGTQSIGRSFAPDVMPSAWSVYWWGSARRETHNVVGCFADESREAISGGTPWTSGSWIVGASGGNLDGYAADYSYHLYGISWNGSQYTCWIDGVSIGSVASVTTPYWDALWIGYTLFADLPAKWRVRDYGITTSVISSDEWQSLRQYFATTYPLDVAGPNVVWIGNSIPGIRYTGPGNSSPWRTLNGISRSTLNRWNNLSVGGRTTPQMTTYVASLYAPSLLSSSSGIRVAVIDEATNDYVLNGANSGAAYAPTAYANYVTLAQTIKAAVPGVRIVVTTCRDRDATNFSAFKNAFRPLVVANTTDWDEVSDLTSLAGIGQDGDYANANFVDGVHISATGANTEAPTNRAAIEAALTP